MLDSLAHLALARARRSGPGAACALTFVLGVTACAPVGDEAPDTPIVEAPLTDSWRTLPLARALDRSSCLVEGVVSAIEPRYDDWAGPRMLVRFDSITVHLGECSGGPLELPIAGGPLPGGGRLIVSDTPRFQREGRYLLLLTSEPWFYSPVELEPLRVERVEGRAVLIGEDGYPLLTVSEQGLVYGPTRLFEPDPDLIDGPATPIDGASPDAVALALAPSDLVELLRAIGEARELRLRGTFPGALDRSHSAWRETPVLPAERPPATPPPATGCEGTVSDEC